MNSRIGLARRAGSFAISLFVFFLVTDAARTTPAAEQQQIDLSGYELRVIDTNDFSRPQKIVREEDLIEESNRAWRRKAKPSPNAEWIAEGKTLSAFG